jgi:hypothetical protein
MFAQNACKMREIGAKCLKNKLGLFGNRVPNAAILVSFELSQA